MRDQITEAALSAASASTKTTAAGGAIAGVGLITSSEIAAIAGVAIACAGFIVNAYYRRKADKRAEQEEMRKARLDALKMAREREEIERIRAMTLRFEQRQTVQRETPRTDTGD